MNRFIMSVLLVGLTAAQVRCSGSNQASTVVAAAPGPIPTTTQATPVTDSSTFLASGPIVVEHQVDEVRGPLGGDHRQDAEVHQQIAVAVEDDRAAMRLSERHAQSDRRGQAHRADHVEALWTIGQ